MTLMTGIKRNTNSFKFSLPTHLCCLLSLPYCVLPTSPPADGWPLTAVFWSSFTVCEPWLFCLVSVCVYTSANIHITLYMLDGDFLWSRADVCVCVCVFYTSRKVLDIAYCLISVSFCVERASMGKGRKAVSPVCNRTQGSFG